MPRSSKSIGSRISQRWIIIVMCCLGLFNTFTTRLCLSIAITEMVLPKNHSIEFHDDTCPKSNVPILHSNQTIIHGGNLDWDEETQGLILSSVFWGYVVTSLLSGAIINKLGAKHTLGLSILIISIVSILTPVTIDWGGVKWLIILRIIMGLADGVIQPVITRLMSQWIPKDERSLAGAWAYSGMPIGIIAGMAGSGFIIERSAMGWPAAFYFYGAVAFLSYLLNCLLCYNSPREHPFISDEERSFLEQRLDYKTEDLAAIPWREMLRSKALWALQISFIGKAWCVLILSSDMPKYMSSVLKLSVETNGYVTSIPHLCSWLFSCLASWMADRLIKNKRMSVGCVRKIGSTISMFGTGFFLLIATYVGCDDKLVLFIQIIAMMMFGCANFGTMVNALDLSPNYAGTIQGVTFAVAMIPSFLSPYVVGLLTPNLSINEWRSVFWMLFGVCVVSNLSFVLFGSGKIQKWNEPRFLKDTNDNAENDSDNKYSEYRA